MVKLSTEDNMLMSDLPTEIASEFRQRLAATLAPLPLEDQRVIIAWVHAALTAVTADRPTPLDHVNAALLAGCIDGSIAVAGVRDGRPTFTLVDAPAGAMTCAP